MAEPNNKISDDNAPNKIQEQFGARLRQVRREKGFTSSEKFSLMVNVNRTQYANYELGKGNIQFDTLVKILSGLDISLKDFFSQGFDDLTGKV